MRKGYLTHAAGVTFPNDKEDGGRERQEILKELLNEGRYHICSIERCKWHNPDTNEDEDAAKVRIRGKVCGWIPKKDLEKAGRHKMMAGEIVLIKDKYCLLLHKHIQPTKQQYALAKRLGWDLTGRPYTNIAYPQIKGKSKERRMEQCRE